MTSPFVPVPSNDPAMDAFAITPSDSEDLPEVPRGIYIGGAGNMKVTMQAGTVATFHNLSVGTCLPIMPSRVWATDTTATNLIGLV